MEAVLQSETSECGLACLTMVLNHHGRTCGLSDLRSRFATGPNGMNLAQVANIARELGFTCRGLRLDCSDLQALRLPAILHWNLDHFVVLSRVRGSKVQVCDPASGRHWLSMAEVDKKFTGVALEIWPGAEMDEMPGSEIGSGERLNLRDLWRSLKGSGQNLIWILSLTVALQVLLLVGPWHVQWLVDEALPSGDTPLIGVLAIGFAGLLLLRVFVHWLRGIVVAELGHSLAFLFSSQMLMRLLHLPLDWYQRRSVGDVISRFDSLGPIREFFTQGAAGLMVDAALIVLSLFLMLVYAPELMAVVLGVQLISVGVSMALTNRIREQSMRTVVMRAREQSHLLESVRGIHSVKVYGQEQGRLENWQRLHGDSLTASLDLQRTHLSLSAWMMLMTGVELIGVISLGGLEVLEGTGFTVGMLMAFLSYRGHFSERLRAAVDQWLNLKSLSVHLQRLEDIWLETPEPAVETLPVGVGNEPRRLSLQSLKFSYAGGEVLLNDASLEVAAGSWISIVGDSGVGKSTVMRLMMGLITPDSGRVYAGDRPLNGGAAVQFRQQCGCVLQEDGFFAGSIADNIALFSSPDMRRIADVIEAVGMTATIERMPMRALTRIGEIGSTLSSGQLQRLYLARALYRNPNYLFLDEGTANLDVESAAVIRKLLVSLTCTRVTVTHDLDFAVCADQVWRLKGGRDGGKFERVFDLEVSQTF